MKKDTRFSIRKLTVGVASIAVASFLTSGSVDAADLSILHSKDEKAAGYNPELPFEPFPPSISYTQPEAPWMLGTVEAEDPEVEVPVKEEPTFTKEEAPFTDRVIKVEEEPTFTKEEAPFTDRVIEIVEEPTFTKEEAPFAGREVEVEEETPETEEEAVFETREEAEEAAMKALENDPINGDFEVAEGADGKYRYVLKPASVIPEDYATEEEAEAAALEALADDDINNAYEIVETADGRYAYLLSIKEEEKQPITLAKPKTVKNPTVLDGQVIQAVDFVTNKADFPVGTEFVFYAYKRSLPLAIQDKAEEFQNVGTLQLEVDPNPESRNQKIEIRAIHPDAKEVAKSIEFTIVVTANSEAILWGIGEGN